MSSRCQFRVDDYTKKWSHASNRPVVSTMLEVMTCPSAPAACARLDNIGAAPGDDAPLGNVANALVRSGLIRRPYDQADIMKKNKYSAWALVLDGQSNTLLLAEDAGRPEHWITNMVRGPNRSVPGGGNNAVTGGRVLGAAWLRHAVARPSLRCCASAGPLFAHRNILAPPV